MLLVSDCHLPSHHVAEMCKIGHFWVLTAVERTFYIGGMKTHNRRCTAVNKNGNTCQAWSKFDSDPPRCSAHAGRNVGAGMRRKMEQDFFRLRS